MDTEKGDKKIVAGITQATQDYLKAIYKLQFGEGGVSTTAVAQRLGISAASATNMVKKLAHLGLVTHTPYRSITLTARGEKVALEIIRHHRLLELFLRQHLGVSLDQVHGEAEELEHVLSEEVESRIAAVLGNPDSDPHGDPIPTKDGAVAEMAHPRLGDLQPGERADVVRVSDEDPRRLRRLEELGLVPGEPVRVLDRNDEGDILVEGTRGRRKVPQQLADGVFVAPSHK